MIYSITVGVFLCVLSYVAVCDDGEHSFDDVKYLNYTKHADIPVINRMNSFLHSTAFKFLCQFDEVENAELLVFATKAWTFPKQNVKLTLSFPMEDADLDYSVIITRFSVMLIVDSGDMRGYITSGGILEESVNLTFECVNVTSLQYEFWVHGLSSNMSRVAEKASAWRYNLDNNNLC
ncbi:unnamed protein product [Diatraea saccharalis]|uniref:Uncharacterized protein n=1 Tax=Diatraea saccharalis TaxID=40085 RepID=A0A9N9R9Z1_9NEOP|nr:unnamed protein product [Diatraea saccharalis]